MFKAFADIDVFDIEVDTEDIDEFVDTVKRIAPTFGGINLEDIKAPECFEIESVWSRNLIFLSCMMTSMDRDYIRGCIVEWLEVSNKKIEQIKVVISGQASALSC